MAPLAADICLRNANPMGTTEGKMLSVVFVPCLCYRVLSCSVVFHSVLFVFACVCLFPYLAVLLADTETGAAMYTSI